jgi:hypothetical protein
MREDMDGRPSIGADLSPRTARRRGTHVFSMRHAEKTWMAATSAAMTQKEMHAF